MVNIPRIIFQDDIPVTWMTLTSDRVVQVGSDEEKDPYIFTQEDYDFYRVKLDIHIPNMRAMLTFLRQSFPARRYRSEGLTDYQKRMKAVKFG